MEWARYGERDKMIACRRYTFWRTCCGDLGENRLQVEEV